MFAPDTSEAGPRCIPSRAGSTFKGITDSFGSRPGQHWRSLSTGRPSSQCWIRSCYPHIRGPRLQCPWQTAPLWSDGEPHDNAVVRSPSRVLPSLPFVRLQKMMSKHPLRTTHSLWYPRSQPHCDVRTPREPRSPCLRCPLGALRAASPCQMRVVVVNPFELLSHPLLPKWLRGLNPAIAHVVSRPCRHGVRNGARVSMSYSLHAARLQLPHQGFGAVSARSGADMRDT